MSITPLYSLNNSQNEENKFVIKTNHNSKSLTIFDNEFGINDHINNEQRSSIKSVLRCETSPRRTRSYITIVERKKSINNRNLSVYNMLKDPCNYKKVLLSVATERRELKMVLYSPNEAVIRIQSEFRRYLVKRYNEKYELNRQVFIYNIIE